MFTGIIEEMGEIKEFAKIKGKFKISIKCALVLKQTKIGDSIAVNGVCLTVSKMGEDFFEADIMTETVKSTAFETLNIKEMVNLERALKLSDRLGGHIVSGHVDGIGIISEIKDVGNSTYYSIEANKDVLKYIVKKGSVCLDGTSLTVTDTADEYFKVSLIPHTKEMTVLSQKKIHDKINVECDIIGKYVESLFFKGQIEEKNKLTEEFLNENGFY